MTDNPLQSYFENNQGRIIHKWLHYFDIYHRHLNSYRGKPVTVLEFGVGQGGSLQMWRDYFGDAARIIGVDIDPRCEQYSEPGIEIYIGDQDDRSFLKELITKVGSVDVVIDDGGHMMTQQVRTFEEVYPFVRDGGVYLTEDLHTSYWSDFDGGYRRPGTFVEYAKALIDDMHAFHSPDPASFPVTSFTRSIGGMHIYDSVVVFDKTQVVPPSHKMTGQAQ